MPSITRYSSHISCAFLVHFLCLINIIIINLVFASALPRDASNRAKSLDSRVLTYPLSNFSVSPPPRDFTIQVNVGSIPLGRITCFEATVTALSQLSELDFNARSTTKQIIRPAAYQARRLALYLAGPYRRGGFDNRYIIWGLTLAMECMTGRNGFMDHQFVLYWQGARVGLITFAYEDPNPSVGANDSAPLLSSVQANLTTGTSKSASRNFNIVYTIHENRGPDLVLNDVLMVIVGGFTDIAPRNMIELVDNRLFETIFPPYTASFQLAPSPGTSSTAWFTYDVVRHALSDLAKWYLSRPGCKPAQLVVYVDGTLGGFGSLDYRPPSSAVSTGPAALSAN